MRQIKRFFAQGLLAAALIFTLTTIEAQQEKKGSGEPRKPVTRTGVMTPGSSQLLRVTASTSTGTPVEIITINFLWKRYMADGCVSEGGGELCRHTVASEETSGPVTLRPGEAAYLDVQGDSNGVQVGVLSDDTEVLVTFQIIDADTGKVVSAWSSGTSHSCP